MQAAFYLIAAAQATVQKKPRSLRVQPELCPAARYRSSAALRLDGHQAARSLDTQHNDELLPMRLLLGLALACSFVCPNVVRGTSAASPNPPKGGDGLIVQTTSGLVQGFLDATTASIPLKKWLGVPFADDTAGKNRWRAPQPVKVKPGHVFNATAFGPACMQGR